MKLAAVYIHEHFLFDRPQTINFGGAHQFEFNLSMENVLRVSIKKNQGFVEGFFGEGISLISALVGANGAGKTNILKVINTGFQENTRAVFIYESADGTFAVDNRSGRGVGDVKHGKGSEFTLEFPLGLVYTNFDTQKLTKLYYSPVFDPVIDTFGTPLRLNSSSPERKIDELFMDNVRKDVVFLHAEVSKTVKEIYPDFPSYDTLYIVPKILHKRDFRKVYIDTNLGNPQKTETLTHTIERDLRVGDYRNPEHLLREYLNIIKSSNITDALKEVWEMPQYQNNSELTGHLLHDGRDFLKNIEINIISFLIINDTFPITRFTGSYDFEKIITSTSFDELLDRFLAKYIVQFDKRFFDQYEDQIRLDNADELISIVMSHYTMYAKTYGDVESDNMLERNIHHNINGLLNIKRLYQIFVQLSDYIAEDDDQAIIKIDVDRKDIEELLEVLFNIYSKVQEYFSHLPMTIKDIIDIDCNVHLSYGEKSILNLYSTFYDFTRTNSHYREAENFLLILDEADLGYHPIWKRKFIHALSSTMPAIFSGLTPMVFDPVTKTKKKSHKRYPNLQIIIATHDALTLSDFPNSNVVYLSKNVKYHTDVLQSSSHSMKSFGANITDLLAHSFFVEDGLIGDFAKKRIEDTIQWLNEERIKKDNPMPGYTVDENKFRYHESIIKIIDEPVIRIKLAQMLDGLTDQKNVQRELIQREMELLNKKLGEL
ncbi:AAA family ATPase [Flavobacterium mesophilum]|uniref:AAA family ATPase n=1 Tax=Flavobacterium mesophilum TaxID=3143495 RepID=UPI0031D4C837